MAFMFPKLDASDLKALSSRAEAKVYRACEALLPERIVVHHSVPFVTAQRNPSDGEADFLLFDPKHGVLVLEVKGGGISYTPERGQWRSLDRTGKQHLIKDPFQQAVKAKYCLREYLQSDIRWQRGVGKGCLFGHGVVFPDLTDLQTLRHPEARRAITGSSIELSCFAEWIDQLFGYWRGEKHIVGPGQAGQAAFLEIFCKPILVRPLLSSVVADDEERHLQLTREQAQILRVLHRRKRAAISGGAGTGKTLLAVQKARELLDQGLRVLLLCYNRCLAEHLRHVVPKSERLLVMNFHQYCDWKIRDAHVRLSRDFLSEAKSAYPGENSFEVHYPLALAMALEKSPEFFDAVIVDEGQDFGEEYWLPIEMSICDQSDSYFYVFYDENQDIYQRVKEFPFLPDEAFSLTANCRNTKAIHACVYAHYSGAPVNAPPIQGEAVEYIKSPTLESQAGKIHSLAVQLIDKEKIAPQDIAVLLVSSDKRTAYDVLIKQGSLPAPASWAEEEIDQPQRVTVDTARRFKGLEAAVVVAWFNGEALPENSFRYVALSRAKSKLYVVGSADLLESLYEYINSTSLI